MEATALRLSGDFSIDALTFDTVQVPEPGPHDVLVAIRAVSLNYRDLMLVGGKYDPNVEKPRILCSDGAGEVLAVGSEVTAFQAGDRVVSGFFLDWVDGPPTAAVAASALGGALDGTLTTCRIFPDHALVPIPSGLSFEEAATFPCAAVTAWHAMVTVGNVGKGDTVLLLGTGGVSIFGLQIAKLRGAKAIITSSSDDKLERTRALGADETINYKQQPEWDKAVWALTNKQGATHVVETGGAGTLPLSLRAAATGAQVSVIGVLTGLEQPLNIGQILFKTLRVQGIYVGSCALLREALEAFAAAGVKPVVDKVFPFTEAPAALRALQAGEHFGKIVITLP
ncbi:MAG: zinc-dependent alcohol dehydrogenase family protein [Janthinobacterium lividum]